jgi:glycosyltransferase involved in cell wall biosynthesis
MTKRIVAVTSDVPFVEGGHLTIARCTIQALKEAGYEADLFLTPSNRIGRLFQAYLATRLTDVEQDGLGRRIHQVISFRYPSYAVKHPFHVCWLTHRPREYYDLWEIITSPFGLRAKTKERVKKWVVHFLDSYLLKNNVTKLFAISQTVQERLKKWGNIKAEVLYPPPPQKAYRTDSYQNFIFSVSRLQKLKRMDLLVDAFKYVKNKECQAYIMGEGSEYENLSARIKENHLEKRVFLLPQTDEETLLDHYARCRAVFFSPFKEDYGFVTAEAFASRKAVLTTRDSGGPTELVNNGQTGHVLEPQPKKIAEKIDELAERKNLAEKMGQNAYEFISKFNWEDIVKKLIIRKS